MSLSSERWTWLASLQDNWDDEGAPAPTADAIARARDLYAEALTYGLFTDDIDADVLGGVAVTFYGRGHLHGNRVWLAVMNGGGTSLIALLDDRGTQGIRMADPSRWRRCVEMLGTNEDGADAREAGW